MLRPAEERLEQERRLEERKKRLEEREKKLRETEERLQDRQQQLEEEEKALSAMDQNIPILHHLWVRLDNDKAIFESQMDILDLAKDILSQDKDTLRSDLRACKLALQQPAGASSWSFGLALRGSAQLAQRLCYVCFAKRCPLRL